MSPNPQPIIHINGYPGTGKLTIARALEQKLAPGARLIHNQSLINPADAVLHRIGPGYQDLLKAICGTVFAALAEYPLTRDSAYTLTEFHSSDAVGSATCAEYLEAAARAWLCACFGCAGV